MIIANYFPRYYQSVLETFKAYPDLFVEAEMRIVEEDLKTGSGEKHYKFVALDDDKPVGYASLATCYETDYSWQVYWLAIHPNYRRQGVGTKLIDKLFQQARDLKLEKIFVETCSCDGEKVARVFYEKNGFARVALIPDYYSKNHSKMVYRKGL